MPMLKRKMHELAEPPQGLKPTKLVFQVQFTKEIFRDYNDYLKHLNLYLQRVWTCKVTGRSNLTYEEALHSEHKETEKIQQFPKESMGHVLSMIQFSTLRLDDLVNKIYESFKHLFMVGEVVVLQKDQAQFCKILSVIPVDEKQENNNFKYESGWLDQSNNVIRTTVESADALIRRKSLFTKALLKSFIRDSAANNCKKNSPWIVHEKLCHEYNISRDPPEELKDIVFSKLLKIEDKNGESKHGPESSVHDERSTKKQRRVSGEAENKDIMRRLDEKIVKDDHIQYPIEDSLVNPSPNDPLFADRPVPSTDFSLPSECIGKLLCVWSFCGTFSKALHLSPFSLEDLERALEYKEGDPLLLRETIYALLCALLTDPEAKQNFVQRRKCAVKISLQSWKDDLCDFLEIVDNDKFKPYVSTIQEGCYRQLEAPEKLDILQELVDCILGSDVIRGQLDAYIEEKQTIAAQNRREELERHKKERDADQATHAICTTVEEKQADENGHVLDCDDGIKKDACSSYSTAMAEVLSKAEQNDEDGEAFSEHGNKSGQSMLKQKAFLKEAEEEHARIEGAKRTKAKPPKNMLHLQKRKEHLEREIEKRVIRIVPLGRDRDYRRYWFFNREGRIFIESEDSLKWSYYGAKEELDALFRSLNPKGVREKALKRQLEKHFHRISDAMQRRSREIALKIAAEEDSLRRSTRVKHKPQVTGFLAYVNKLRNSVN